MFVIKLNFNESNSILKNNHKKATEPTSRTAYWQFNEVYMGEKLYEDLQE